MSIRSFFTLLLVCFAFLAKTQEKEPGKKPALLDAARLIEEGSELYQEEDYEEAIAKYDSVREGDSLYMYALASQAEIHLDQGDYEKAVQKAEKGLERLPRSNHYRFLLAKGKGLKGQEKFEEALEVFEKGLDTYSWSHEFHYHKGKCLQGMGKEQEALKAFKRTVHLTPFFPGAHLELARKAAQEGEYAKALMSYASFLCMEPGTKRSKKVLKEFTGWMNGERKPDPQGMELSANGDDLSKIDRVIKSKVALSDDYEVDADISHPVVKQLYAFQEKLEYEPEAEGFWNTYYVPYFHKLQEEGMTEDLAYYIMIPSDDRSVYQELSSNKRQLRKFGEKRFSSWQRWTGERPFQMGSSETEKEFWYEGSPGLSAIGDQTDGETKVGTWRVFHSSGALGVKGKYDQEGEKTGKWNYYRMFGRKKEEVHYGEGGAPQGSYLTYYPNGKKKNKLRFEEGERQGKSKFWKKSGALKIIEFYDEGALTDTAKHFYPDGSKKLLIPYKDGEKNGTFRRYYFNGVLAWKASYEDGERNGTVESFYNNGQLQERVNYKEGKAEGETVAFYRNGKKKYTGSYKEGERSGEWSHYYRNGELEREAEFDEDGDLTGNETYYDQDGDLYAKVNYKRGKIKEMTFFDKKGEVMEKKDRSWGKLEFVIFYPDRVIKAKGLLKRGDREGEWKFYDKNGVLSAVRHYEDGVKNGVEKVYHDNGQLAYSLNYNEGEEDGYFVYHYRHGKVEKEGWYKDGEKVGPWRYYYPDGTLDRRLFYVNGSVNGYVDHRAVDGSPEKRLYFEDGDHLWTIYYDPSGEPYDSLDYRDDQETLRRYHFNDSLAWEGSFIHGEVSNGDAVWYDHRGNKVSEGTYRNDEKVGNWKWFEDGKLEQEGSYLMGEKDSVWKDYYDSGELYEVSHYRSGRQVGKETRYYKNGNKKRVLRFKDGDLHGPYHYYHPSGKLGYVKYFKHGKWIGYSYKNEKGELVDTISLENETGDIEAFYKNGNKYIEYRREHGDVVGEMVKYHPNGEVWERIPQKVGEYHGTVKHFYQNGQLKYRKEYQNGDLHGKVKHFYKSGKPKKKGHYLNGEAHGKFQYFDKEGELERTVRYFNGEVVSEEKADG